jgi:Holliday junction DNA helicase RuvA
VFESIQGRLSAKEPARVVVEAGGLGYLVSVPLSTYDALPAVGHDVRLLLHPVVREDEWRLYGFSTPREREVFRDLLRVSGVGPALSLSLLSGLGPEALVKAVREGDVRSLTNVRGVGRKTAERLVVDLKERWPAGAAGAAAAARSAEGPGADAVRALEALGLERAEAEQRVAKTLPAAGPLPGVGEIVRRALRGKG